MELSNLEMGKYLKSLREAHNLSTHDVNKLSGVSQSYLSLIENGKRKASAIILKTLARVYNVDYLLLYEKAGYVDLIEDEKKKELTISHFYMCPVYGRIAAGEPNWAEECIEGRFPIDPDLMNIANPEECFFLRVNGESMNKEIKNGAYALIMKTDFVEDGEIAAVLVNGCDATLKVFNKQGDFILLEPMSTDPSFKTQVYDKNTQIKVIGKYIGKMEMK